MRRWMTGLLVLLSACQANPQQQPLDNPAVIAELADAQRRIPPFKAIAPQQLASSDFAQMDDSGASCAFYLDSVPEARALLLIRPNFGWIKLQGKLLRLGTAAGSARGPLGTRIAYKGRELALRIEPSDPDQAALSGERQIVPAQLVVSDAWNRTVFAAAGTLRCAAQ